MRSQNQISFFQLTLTDIGDSNIKNVIKLKVTDSKPSHYNFLRIIDVKNVSVFTNAGQIVL